LDISKLARVGEFGMELESLGRVSCLSLKAGHLSQGDKKLGAANVESHDFVRWLFGEMARRPSEGRSDEDDPSEGTSLAAEELRSVTDSELEKFADKLIQKNKYLLKTHKGSDIEKSADESACDFLVRAFRHHAAEEKAKWKQMNQPALSSLFSSPTLELMQRNLGLSDQLQESIDRYTVLSTTERLLAEEKDKWMCVSQSVSQPFSASAAAGTMQQALDAIAGASQYLTEYSVITTMEKTLKQEQDLMRATGSFKDISCHLEENSASASGAMHFKYDQDLIRATTGQFQDAQRCFEEISTSTMLAKAIYHNEDMLRETARGLALSNTMSSDIAASLEKQLQETRDLLKCQEAMFRLPLASEASCFWASYHVGAVAEFAQQLTKDTLDQQRFLESITTPWLNNIDEARSVTALLELQGMGNALRTTKGFDPELTAALRLDLGDWRDKITFPESVIIDPVSRTDFYVARGFNTALTDFPEAAFHRSLHVAGLDGDALEFELFGAVARPSAEPEEAGLRRTNKCHDRLQRFERQFRQFINDAMTAQYGSDWPRKKLDPILYEKWEDKKRKAESNGAILMFIEVADFTDYEKIICKQDHWREIFETRFKKKESVRESLQRLHPIRLATMHARIVTKEDKLYLISEITRLLSALK